MRTDEEIKEHIKKLEKHDFFGFSTSDLLMCLPFEEVKDILKEGVTKDQWVPEKKDRISVIQRMLDYMPFAWEKANNCRGLSANRSICHYEAWLWLLGDAEAKLIDDIPYEHYGKEKLIAICEHFGWDWKKWDDGIRTNTDI